MAIVTDMFCGTYSHLTYDGGRVHITEECTHLIPQSVSSVCVFSAVCGAGEEHYCMWDGVLE